MDTLWILVVLITTVWSGNDASALKKFERPGPESNAGYLPKCDPGALRAGPVAAPVGSVQ